MAGRRARWFLIAALMSLSALAIVGGGLATSSGSSINPATIFQTALLILSDTKVGGTTCLSNQPAHACDAILSIVRGAPGDSAAGQVILRDVGPHAVAGLTVSTPGCSTGNAAGEQFHGAGDVCDVTDVVIHDDSHDFCYFPVRSPGACAYTLAGTLRSFADTYGGGRPLPLNASNLSAGTAFTIAVRIDPEAGDAYQGRTATIDLVWQGTAG